MTERESDTRRFVWEDGDIDIAEPVEKYDPSQPRAVAGTATGGRWVKQGGEAPAPFVDNRALDEADDFKIAVWEAEKNGEKKYTPGENGWDLEGLRTFETAKYLQTSADGYWITPDNIVIEAESHTKAAMTILRQNPDKFPGADWKAGRVAALNALVKEGHVRVATMRNTTILESKVDSAMLRRIQKLHYAGKLELAPRVEWAGPADNGDPSYIAATLGEFLEAKYVTRGVLKADRAGNDLTQHEHIATWLTKIAASLPPSPLDERLEKALGYTPELYRVFISHGVGRFMAGQINDEYLRGITRGTIEHGLAGAWVDGMEQNGLAYPDDMMPEWRMELDAMIDKEESFLDGFIHAMELGKERIKAGGSYNKELEQALKRAELWGRRYNDIKQRALRITAASPKAKKLARKRAAIRMVWKLGHTEQHCPSCIALNGVVAFEWEWERSGYFPRIPNGKLECNGFKCDCTCEPTELRRSKALRNGRALESWIPERIARIKALGVAGAKLGSGITKYDENQPRDKEGRWVITSDGMSLYHVTLRDNLTNIKSLGLLRSSKVEAYSMGEGNTQIDGVFLGTFEQAKATAAQIKGTGGDPVILDVYVPAKSKIYEDITMPESAVLYPGDIPSRHVKEYAGTYVWHKDTNFLPWFQTGKMPKSHAVAKYDPSQERAPEGTDTGGQWTSGGVNRARHRVPRSDIVQSHSDTPPERPSQAPAAPSGHQPTRVANDYHPTRVENGPPPRQVENVTGADTEDVNTLMAALRDKSQGAEHGFSYQPESNTMPINGFMVSDHETRGKVMAYKDCTRTDIGRFLVDNADLLSQPNHYFGGWISEGRIYLDVSERLETPAQADALGMDNRQEAYFDIKNRKSVFIDYHGNAPAKKLDQAPTHRALPVAVFARPESMSLPAFQAFFDDICQALGIAGPSLTAAEWSAFMDAAEEQPVKKYDPDQPRAPEGSETGGQWTKEGAPKIEGTLHQIAWGSPYTEPPGNAPRVLAEVFTLEREAPEEFKNLPVSLGGGYSRMSSHVAPPPKQLSPEALASVRQKRLARRVTAKVPMFADFFIEQEKGKKPAYYSGITGLKLQNAQDEIIATEWERYIDMINRPGKIIVYGTEPQEVREKAVRLKSEMAAIQESAKARKEASGK